MVDENARVDHQVRRVRESILERHGLPSDAEIPSGTTGSPIEDAAQRSVISAHWGIASNVPVFGGFIVLAQRVCRLLLRWYINPIVEQQNAFNEATVRALYELQSENDELRAKLNHGRTGHTTGDA